MATAVWTRAHSRRLNIKSISEGHGSKNACGAQSDEGRQRLRRQLLSGEQALAAALAWRADCARLAVERAALWMPPPAHFGPCRRRGPGLGSWSGSDAELAQLGRGLGGVELTDGQALRPSKTLEAGLVCLAQPAAMDVDGGPGSAAGRDGEGCRGEPVLRGRLAAATGHVDVCGVALPCGPDASGGGGGGAGELVRTPTVLRNLEAAALALCQQRPLLLEGPPGVLSLCGRSSGHESETPFEPCVVGTRVDCCTYRTVLAAAGVMQSLVFDWLQAFIVRFNLMGSTG